MSSMKRFLIVPAAVVAMIVMSSNLSAQCNSCASSGGTFGYPGSCQGCDGGVGGSYFGGGGSGAISNFRQGIESYKADWRLNHARSSAWPLPFSCWDREHYHAIFNQQYATGNQIAHTLTSENFNSETNELNRSGELKISWIMSKSAQDQKQIYIYEDETGPTTDQRLASVRNFASRYYSHLGNAQIAKSHLLPHQIPASYQSQYSTAYAEGQPDPVIPVNTGATINASVGN